MISTRPCAFVRPSFFGKTRYSYLLTLLFVGMAYSGGMFAINVLSFLFFMLTYWVDKAMLLRFYKRPPHREDALQRQVSLISSSCLVDCPCDVRTKGLSFSAG